MRPWPIGVFFYLRRGATPTVGAGWPLRWATLARCALSNNEMARSINTISGLWTSSDVALALWTETREKNSCIRLNNLGNPSTKAWSKNCDATRRHIDEQISKMTLTSERLQPTFERARLCKLTSCGCSQLLFKMQ